MIKTGVLPYLVILFGTSRSQRDGLNLWLQGLGFRDEIQPVTVGKPEIAQKNVDRGVPQKLQRLRNSVGRDHFMTGALEERGKHAARISMIFDEENSHGSRLNRFRRRI